MICTKLMNKMATITTDITSLVIRTNNKERITAVMPFC